MAQALESILKHLPILAGTVSGWLYVSDGGNSSNNKILFKIPCGTSL